MFRTFQQILLTGRVGEFVGIMEKERNVEGMKRNEACVDFKCVRKPA